MVEDLTISQEYRKMIKGIDTGTESPEDKDRYGFKKA